MAQRSKKDYIVATAARDLDLFIARDPKAPSPGWLREYRPAGGKVVVNGRKLSLHVRRLKKDDVLRIPGNTDQGVAIPNSGLNLIVLARPAGQPPATTR